MASPKLIYLAGRQFKTSGTHPCILNPKRTKRLQLHAKSELESVTTRRSPRDSLPPNLEGYVTKIAPHKAFDLILGGKLTFDERVIVHRVG